LEVYPEYHTYKLQHCNKKKIYPSLIHANRFRLCNTGRDALYSKYGNDTDVVTDTTDNIATDIENTMTAASTRSGSIKGEAQ